MAGIAAPAVVNRLVVVVAVEWPSTATMVCMATELAVSSFELARSLVGTEWMGIVAVASAAVDK